jgi:hypothetical protein
MAAQTRPGLCPGVIAHVLAACIALCLPCLVARAAGASPMPRITARGDRLYAGDRPWRAWGMNWGAGDHEPVLAYFDHPTATNLAVLSSELHVARAMGANSMRIYLELGQVMATPTRPRQRTLTALTRLLALAQSSNIYLDITGDLVWRPSRAPNWYAQMPWHERWQVQARFWRAVAHTAASSPAVLCYELTSEPIVSPTKGYYFSPLGGFYFNQSIATASGPHADTLARSWTRLLATTVHSEDDRPVTIGLLPKITGPFSPANVADLLDLLTVHEYPTTGNAQAAVTVIRSFAAHHRPLLLGETAMLDDDAATQHTFLTDAASYLSGSFEFFDGRDPADMQALTIADAVYQQGLEQFMTLRTDLLSA